MDVISWIITLVVIAVIALATGLVAPGSWRMMESWRRDSEARALLIALASLPASVREQGAVVAMKAGRYDQDFAGITLPEGWTIELDREFRVLANGACLGTTGTLVNEGFTQPFALDSPYCRARRTDGSQ